MKIFKKNAGNKLLEWIMAILSKGRKPGDFESHNSLKLNFINTQGPCVIFVEYESFFESNFPDILALCETNKLRWLNWLLQFLYKPFSFCPKGFYYLCTWSCSICERRTSFCTRLIARKLCKFLLMFLTSFTGIWMNILQRGFFKTSRGDLLTALRFLGGIIFLVL